MNRDFIYTSYVYILLEIIDIYIYILLFVHI